MKCLTAIPNIKVETQKRLGIYEGSSSQQTGLLGGSTIADRSNPDLIRVVHETR